MGRTLAFVAGSPYFASMPTLLEKITASAAERLPLPPSRQPSQELARYKNFLKVESHRLKILHHAGAGGREICRARAAVLDVLLCAILEAVKNNPRVESKTAPPAFALVAIGGYGRGELNPQSDIDIMFLHNADSTSTARGKPHPNLSALTDGLLYTLWDVGLKVGHSVRTTDDCVKIANSDMQAKTSLIEARFITGDAGLFKRMETVVLARCVRGFADEYIAARLADQEARRAKFGNSATMQEPNIKNGCGGLRDFQNLIWMAFFKYRTRSLAELEKRELISESERKQLEAAYDFLLRARNDLHYHVNRPADVLTKSLQPAIAHNLGYTDRSPVKRLEGFMGDLYSHMRNIHLITRTLEQRLALLPHSERRLPSFGELLRHGRRRFQRQLVDGFKCVDGEIYPLSGRVFRDQPRRLMRVFLYAQQRGLRLRPDVAQLIRHQLSFADRALLPHAARRAARAGRHTAIGGRRALNVARRLGLDGATSHTLRLIIEHHLAMSQISQRRDLDDPAVIRNFAAQIQGAENLKLLALHTFADALGTSDQLWNGFKDSLLLLLFRKTMEQFTGGTAFIRAEEKQRELLAEEVRRLLPATISEEELQAHFATLPPRHFQIHAAKDVLADLTLAHLFMRLQFEEYENALAPVVTWHNEADRGYTAVKVCTWDRHGLFSKIAGSFTAAGLNILNAQIFTRNDGVILDTFYVIDTKTGLLAGKDERDRFEKFLNQALTGEMDLSALIAWKSVAQPLYQSLAGERIPTVTRFDNETSDTRTVIDLETEDHVGLLYTISQALAELDLDIYLAKISTEKGAAIDSFYVSERDGGKVLAAERQREIERKLSAAIARLERS